MARSYFIDIISILEKSFYNFEILCHFKDSHIEKTATDFKNITEYIDNHLEESHTLESLYKKFYINKNQIENLFKQHLNTTFFNYLRKKRFEQAVYYLKFTALDGEQIASRIGLSSSQNFCRFFKEMCGKSPNKFRKEMILEGKKDTLFLKLSELSHISSL